MDGPATPRETEIQVLSSSHLFPSATSNQSPPPKPQIPHLLNKDIKTLTHGRQ
jgi:hypothetical protein